MFGHKSTLLEKLLHSINCLLYNVLRFPFDIQKILKPSTF
jgi:hypothetical protein